MKWYAVMTSPRSEEVVTRDLKRSGYWTFYPFERVRRRRKRPNVDKYLVEWINRPLYSRYVFVAVKDGQGLYGVTETDGVVTVVCSGNEPLEIPHSVMERLIEQADSKGQVGAVDLVARPRFKPGQAVRFQDNSPMSGLLAQIALDNGKEVRVWLDVLGARRLIGVDPAAVAEIA